VAVRRFPDETVVLNLATGDYHGLDDTGAAFLEAIETSPDLGAATKALAAAYDVDRDRLRGDLEEFCERLRRRGLIDRVHDEPA